MQPLFLFSGEGQIAAGENKKFVKCLKYGEMQPSGAEVQAPFGSLQPQTGVRYGYFTGIVEETERRMR